MSGPKMAHNPMLRIFRTSSHGLEKCNKRVGLRLSVHGILLTQIPQEYAQKENTAHINYPWLSYIIIFIDT